MQKKSKIGHFQTAVSPCSYEFSKTFRSLRIRYLYSVSEILRVGALPPQKIFYEFLNSTPYITKIACERSQNSDVQFFSNFSAT